MSVMIKDTAVISKEALNGEVFGSVKIYNLDDPTGPLSLERAGTSPGHRSWRPVADGATDASDQDTTRIAREHRKIQLFRRGR